MGRLKLGVFLLLLGIIIIVGWASMRITASYEFSNNCGGYLKRAADANTIEIAKDQLDLALKYIENRNLTSGTVSIFMHQPKNDIGFWYNNLKTSRAQLDKVKEDSSELEKSNILMKLRETLTDQNEDGTVITIPDGISIYPSNVAYFMAFLFGLIILIVGLIICIIEAD